ncbi:type I-F CRISPR-associated protein Csy2 [Salinisphaera sp. Q1T1-3]|uniref:type I-F CRISPR-associated protein Csy2 n=1 Tax=Salinisphaera sp. Q1T1-3 TaxID=2321229 RepID=UPI000E7155D5|nr:type I-F CRISPR-associated protein Csy2 [Salinisphaera sp. Q1T1-3]RJS94787.1 type I-F CRISPR-associated protein Csy2 [Salinisphaera sp. Q1T1-3]
MTDKPRHLLTLPHLKVQNANAISSPMTWGFPAMSAFVGFMHALDRRLPDDDWLAFKGVGVVCHSHEIQSSPAGYNLQQFHLTRNPVGKDGTTAAIAEEGRMHMDISLVFSVRGDNCIGSNEARQRVADAIFEHVHGMRLAGGSILGDSHGKQPRPKLHTLSDDSTEYEQQFRQLKRTLLPGFTLVLNEPVLQGRLEELQANDPNAGLLDAWLDFARLHHDYHTDDNADHGRWEIRSRPGWHVPIPVGYGALSPRHDPGEVAKARDTTTPFRFVESLYSIGQWVSPHRLNRPEALLWYVDNDLDQGIYRLNNDYATQHAKN